MADNKFRELIKSGRYNVGLGISIANRAVLEMAAYAGFDWVHFIAISPGIVEGMGDLVTAAEATQTPFLVTVPGNNPDPVLISKALDLGADGMHFSLVSTKQQVEKIVKLCRMPPEGEREVFPGGRAGRYWGIPMEDYVHRANDAVISIKIESKEGLDNAEEIINVPGVDMVFLGDSDVSRSLGVDRYGPEMFEAKLRIIKLAKAAGVTPLSVAMTSEDLGKWLKIDNSLRTFFMATDGTQIGYHFRGLTQRCKELFTLYGEGDTVGALSRVPLYQVPWDTAQIDKIDSKNIQKPRKE